VTGEVQQWNASWSSGNASALIVCKNFRAPWSRCSLWRFKVVVDGSILWKVTWKRNCISRLLILVMCNEIKPWRHEDVHCAQPWGELFRLNIEVPLYLSCFDLSAKATIWGFSFHFLFPRQTSSPTLLSWCSELCRAQFNDNYSKLRLLVLLGGLCRVGWTTMRSMLISWMSHRELGYLIATSVLKSDGVEKDHVDCCKITMFRVEEDEARWSEKKKDWQRFCREWAIPERW
jgi:hypothetical protein